jgi:hypothetical protein
MYETKMQVGGISNDYQDILLAKLHFYSTQSTAASRLMSKFTDKLENIEIKLFNATQNYLTTGEQFKIYFPQHQFSGLYLSQHT